MGARLAGLFPDCTVERYEGCHHLNTSHQAEPERVAGALEAAVEPLGGLRGCIRRSRQSPPAGPGPGRGCKNAAAVLIARDDPPGTYAGFREDP